MNKTQLNIMYWVGAVIVALSIFGVISISQKYGAQAARGMFSAWMLFVVCFSALGMMAYSYYRSHWDQVTNGAGGASSFIFWIVTSIAVASLLNAARVTLLN